MKREIKYIEEPDVRALRIIREQGYIPCDTVGYRNGIEREYNNAIGILKEREPEIVEKKTLFGKRKTIHKHHRPIFFCRIWFNNEARGASRHKKWVVEVFGREYVGEATELVKKIAEPYDVKLEIRLVTEKPYSETYLEDFSN